MDANRRALASSRVKTKCVRCVGLAHARDVFLAFQIANTARILRLKPCALDLRFLTENLPFFPTTLLRRPPSSMKPRPGVWRWSSRPWRVSSFHCLSLQILRSSWRIFYILRPPTPRTSGPRHSTFSRLAAYSPAYTELVEVLARATKKLSLDWPDEPCESQSSKLD